MIIWDQKLRKLFAARDPIGIRPLFYGYGAQDGKIMFASEMKVLSPLCTEVQRSRPATITTATADSSATATSPKTERFNTDPLDKTLLEIRERLIEAVRKRLVADVPVGYLLSGGLDSSLVCGIAAHVLNKPLITFAVGLDQSPIDLPYAEKSPISSIPTTTKCASTENDTLGCVDDVIWHTETWDITTIRASIGMYLVCRHIHRTAAFKVLLTGEVSDEIFGYKYTDFAPDAEAFQQESVKRIDELYMYDVLRADRCISAHSLEARVPFADLDFVSYCMAIPPRAQDEHPQHGQISASQSIRRHAYRAR